MADFANFPTARQTKQYDRGYEDAIEGRKEQSEDYWYQRGYRAGIAFKNGR